MLTAKLLLFGLLLSLMCGVPDGWTQHNDARVSPPQPSVSVPVPSASNALVIGTLTDWADAMVREHLREDAQRLTEQRIESLERSREYEQCLARAGPSVSRVVCLP